MLRRCTTWSGGALIGNAAIVPPGAGLKSPNATTPCSVAQHELQYKKVVKWFPKALRCQEYGKDVLDSSLWNKGLAFDYTERDRLGLRGLLPPVVRSLEEQVTNTFRNMESLPDDVAKSMYLQELHCRNETLFHRVLLDHIELIAPLVYTPTVGAVCEKFGKTFRRPRGMFFSAADRGHFSTMIYNWDADDVHVIVVTDGSRILGLGDLGAHGMGIPIGKLALYCAAGGIAPHRVLPVMLDVGTNNEKLLADPNYIGVRHKRLEGAEYYDMVDEFMGAVYGRYPDVCVQFEDFDSTKAQPLLDKYRDKFRCFNDDVQGTGAVVVAAIMGGCRVAQRPFNTTRVLCAGAGAAGLGVCGGILDALAKNGLPKDEAKRAVAVADYQGVIGRPDGVYNNPHYENGVLKNPNLLPWVTWELSDGMPLAEAATAHQSNCLLGLTTKKGAFDEKIIKAVAANVDRPIIMPLSNPTAKCECTPDEAKAWSDGRAIVATGSPFPGISQCNNMYIFPGLGLAASVGGVTRFTDDILLTAAEALANSTSEEDLAAGRVFPPVSHIRTVAKDVAAEVIKKAFTENMTTKIKKHHYREGIDALISRKMYYPEYFPIRSTKHDDS